jgi:hypothetical protein
LSQTTIRQKIYYYDFTLFGTYSPTVINLTKYHDNGTYLGIIYIGNKPVKQIHCIPQKNFVYYLD